MNRTRILTFAAALMIGQSARAALADFDFSERYQTVGMTGEIIGLSLDVNGNATNADPAEVLLFTVPPNVGITASLGSPYVFVPHTYEQYHEDPFSHPVTLNTTTTPGVYGFNVQNGQILPSTLDLAMADSSNVVNLFFNSGSFVTAGGSAAEYGMTADGESDYYWPTVNSFISYAPVPEPGGIAIVAVAAASMLFRLRKLPPASGIAVG